MSGIIGVALCASSAVADESPARPGLAVYALSRGAGVPQKADEVLASAERVLRQLEAEGKVVRLHPVERLGLEGERRLCAEFSNDRSARDVFERIQRLARGVDLLNVVLEPCSREPRNRGE